MPLAPPVTSAMRSSSRTAGSLSGPVASPGVEPVPIIGGTGSLGFGLALRWARAGVPVVIGSRAAERAEESAAKLRERVPDAQVEGLENAEAARRGPIVVLAVPLRNHSENLTTLREVLAPGQILLDAPAPLAAALSRMATRLLG